MEPTPQTQPPTLARGESVELQIDALAAGGDGVGRLPDGRVVFVPLAAPGDRIRARIASLSKRFARAEVEEVLEPGPSRVEPRCAAFGECGGCAWQHVDYAAQCAAKQRIVEDALRRLGRLAPTEITFHPSPEPWAYRARARLLVKKGRVGYRRRGSHTLRAVDACPVLAPRLEVALRGLGEDPPPDGEWEIAGGDEGVCAHAIGGEGDAVAIDVAGFTLRISPGVFYQAHADFHEPLVAAVTRAAGRGTLALELFAGGGFFTLPLSRAFERVVAIEGQPEAVDDLRHNLAEQQVQGVEVLGESVEAALAREDPTMFRPDALVLDPPRAGLEPEVCAQILAMEPRRIVYLSCDPATLARDLGILTGAGFALGAVEAFDLFPQTPHVEVLATLLGPESGDESPPT